ncbi:MAG: hypothetical protein ACKOXZ_04775, partial [Polynucleobacter victoriensis]
MIGSAISGISLGASLHAHWSIILILAFIHSIFIMADSATLTAGLVISVPQDIKGAAMGLHYIEVLRLQKQIKTFIHHLLINLHFCFGIIIGISLWNETVRRSDCASFKRVK